MTRSAVRRWSNPEVILVATTLLEGPSVMLHPVYQAKLSGARILLVHVVRPSDLRASSNAATPFVLPSPAFCAVQVALNQMAKTFSGKEFRVNQLSCEGLSLSKFRYSSSLGSWTESSSPPGALAELKDCLPDPLPKNWQLLWIFRCASLGTAHTQARTARRRLDGFSRQRHFSRATRCA
jgi:hypothetical protein